MGKTPVCLVCQKQMELGFMTDLGHANAIRIPRWHEGEPKRGFFGEAKRAQLTRGLKVVAYRCPQCEALRLYAPSTHE